MLSAKQRRQSLSSFREALIAFLYDEDTWSASVAALSTLAEAIENVAGGLAKVEVDAFDRAAEESLDTLFFNVDDPDQIEGEAQALDKLSKHCGLDRARKVQSMYEKASSLREETGTKRYGSYDEYRYETQSGERFDIDGLFSTLLDR